MAFTSIYFLIFVLATVCVYYAVPIRCRWIVLLASSYAFYLMSSPNTFVFLLFTTAVTFFGGRYIGSCNDRHREYLEQHKAEMSKDEKRALKAEVKNRKLRMVVLILVVDFGILAVLKYFGYYLQAAKILDTGELLIPLGISFYTFQSAAYIFDLYRSKIDADRNIAKFALFTAFFPQIVQGPISRHDQLAAQLYEGHRFDYRNLTFGAQLMLWGFFKKLVIADRVAILCNEVFDNYEAYAGGTAFAALLFYTIQIYADFSGGIDIARGTAQCMGIDMTDNFRRPYFSNSLSDFWNRWHISLSHWCRDYIFYPVAMSKFFGKLGKNLRAVLGDRVGKLFPVIIAQYCTFLMIGLWHGADFTYIAYGLYNGTVIVLGLLAEPYLDALTEKLHINTKSRAWRIFQSLRTFLIVVFGRVLSRALSFGAAVSMFCSVFRPNHGSAFGETVTDLGLYPADFIILAVCMIVWFAISFIEETKEPVRELLSRRSYALRWTLMLILLAAVLMLGIYGPGYDASAFIYRGF